MPIMEYKQKKDVTMMVTKIVTKKDNSAECEQDTCDGGVNCYCYTHPSATTCKRCFCRTCIKGKCPPSKNTAKTQML